MPFQPDDWVVGYFTDVLRASVEHPTWRLGQTYFNVLYAKRPELADTIRGTYLDPFYSNGGIPAFLKWLVDTLAAEDAGDTGESPVVEEPKDGSDA